MKSGIPKCIEQPDSDHELCSQYLNMSESEMYPAEVCVCCLLFVLSDHKRREEINEKVNLLIFISAICGGGISINKKLRFF